ncbi:microtubule-associated protein futsch [Scleropages formosus]|uniref:microtubule-associated protein futsch n=1 Tax=Scleropages formosus TaxID=113540 RepID=UPI0010FAA6F0|nr:microtubule-associated protein futsch-like [Scleropages formosus]
MKPDGVATAAMEAMEGAGAESAAEALPAEETAQPLQTEEVKKDQPEVTPPAEKAKNSKAGEPKAKAKAPAKAASTTKTPQKAGAAASTKPSLTSAPSSRPSTAKSRPVNGVQKQPTSNGAAKKADVSAPEKKKSTPAPASAKRPVGAPATSPAKPAEKKPAGVPKPTPSPAASSGAKTAGTPSPNKKALVGPSNGTSAKPKTAAPRPASAAPSKPGSVAATKPDKPPVSKTTRSASGAPGARPAPVASTGKPAPASTRPAPSKTSTTAPSAGRTSTGQTPKPATPAKKDVSRPTATTTKKPSESVNRPSPAKISKNEPPKLSASKTEATAKRPPSGSKPTEQKPARTAPQESKVSASPRSTGSKPGAGKAAVQTPKKAVGSSTPMPVKRTPKPSQSVQSTNVVEESTKENGSEKISAPAINPVALAPSPSDSQEVGLGDAPVAQKEEVPEPVEPQNILDNPAETKAEVVEMSAPRPESLQDLDSVAVTEEAALALGTIALSPPSSPPSPTQLAVRSPSPLEEDAQCQDLSESQNQPASVVAPEDSQELEPEHQQDVLLSATLESVSQATIPSNDLTLSSPAGEHEVAVEKAEEEINVDDDDEDEDEEEEKQEESDLQMVRNQPMEESLGESTDPSGYTEPNNAPTLEPEAEDVSGSYQELQEEGTHETQHMDESLHEVDDLAGCTGQKQPLTPELETDNEGMNGSHKEVPEQGPNGMVVEESADLASFTEQQSDSALGLDGEDDMESSNQETLEQATHGTLLTKDSLKELADMAGNTQLWDTLVPELKTENENVYISHPKAPEQGELGAVVIDESLKESTDLASCTGLQHTPTLELDTEEEDLHDYYREEQEQDTHGTFVLEEPLEESSNVATSGGLQHTPTPELDTEDEEEVNDLHKKMLEQDSQKKLLVEEKLKESSDLTSCMGLQHTPTPEVDTEDEGINDSHPDILEQGTHSTLLSEEPLNQSADLDNYTSLQRTPTPDLDTEDEEVNESHQETECHSPRGTHLMQESVVESKNLATGIESHHMQVLELDSEDMNSFEQELQDRSILGLLQSMESACNMEEGNLKGQEEEPEDVLPDNIEAMPEISENNDESEEEQDEDMEDDMDVGSDGVEEPCGVLSAKNELHEALEITKEGMLESFAKEDVLTKEDHRTDMTQDLQLPTVLEDCLHQFPQLVPAHPADSSSEPYASDPTIEFQPPWLELGAVPQKEDSLYQAAGELDSPVEERDLGAIASAVCQPDSLGTAELVAHCSSGSETGTPEELVDYDSSSGVESRSEGKQRTPVPPAQPDIEQDLGIHLERGDCEGEEEEAETLPADEILGDPPTAHTSAPSTPSTSGDEASDTEGEVQIDDPATHGIDNAAFDNKTAAHDLPALDEGLEGEEDGGTPQSAASAPSYAFDCPTSNAHSTAESCGKSPGLFSLENEDQLPEEAKDPSLVRELTLPAAVGHADLLGTAVDLLPIGQHHEDEDEQQEDEDEEQEEEEADQEEDQYLLCGKPGIELPGSLGSAGSMETDRHLSPRHSAVEDPDAQPPYFSAICDKTDNALAGNV